MFQDTEVIKLKKKEWKMQVEMTDNVQQIKKKVQADIMKDSLCVGKMAGKRHDAGAVCVPA